MRDIENTNDIREMVHTFYGMIRADTLLSPIFSSRIPDEGWDAHLETMCDFWNSVICFERNYKGNPFSKHIVLPVNENHFERWIELFHDAMNQNFQGEKADEIKKRAENMTRIFSTKIHYLNRSEK